MNIEIANRLVKLRKENNLSQEALADKLGISRQAVSKWERAESSPDTDNLIELAKLYNISLDELLNSDQEEFESGNTSKKSEYVDISTKGIHVIDKEGKEVHVGWDGIHVDEGKDGHQVNVDKDGVFIDGEKYDHKDFPHHNDHKSDFPFVAIIAFIYIIIGLCYNMWHPGWLIFFLLPIFDTLVTSVKRKDPTKFAYPVLAALIFLYVGLIYQIWNPTWAIFLTIPIYYSIAGYFTRRKK